MNRQASLILSVHENQSALYLGDISDVRNKYLVQLAHITHVISVLEKDYLEEEFGHLNKPYSSSYNEHLKNVKHLQLEAEDYEMQDITQLFDKAFEFIEDALYKSNSNKTNNVLIHCAAGVSRSPSVTIAYLMWKNKMRFKDALSYVVERRSIVAPNPGFVKLLENYDKKLFGQGQA